MEIGRLLEIESANEFDDHLCLNSISLVIGPYATVPFCEVRDAARDWGRTEAGVEGLGLETLIVASRTAATACVTDRTKPAGDLLPSAAGSHEIDSTLLDRDEHLSSPPASVNHRN